MLYKKTLTLATVLLLVVSLSSIGCSGTDETKTEGTLSKVIDTAATQVVKEVIENVLEINTPEVLAVQDEPEEVETKTEYALSSSEMLLVGDMLYAVSNGKLIAYDFASSSSFEIASGEVLNAVAYHENKIYVGGDKLYRLMDSSLEVVDESFTSEITDLYSYGYKLMIGTQDGLYQKGLLEKELVLEGKSITAIVADYTGLWVGTDGDGLYRWDGDDFKKRFLIRDETLFDNVNTLAFNHNHLYMGTPNGFHVYDGGRWNNLTVLDGLPSENVIAIDASGWIVNVVTEDGMATYFKKELEIVNVSSDVVVENVLKRKNKTVILSNASEIFLKGKNSMEKIYSPIDNTPVVELGWLGI